MLGLLLVSKVTHSSIEMLTRHEEGVCFVLGTNLKVHKVLSAISRSGKWFSCICVVVTDLRRDVNTVICECVTMEWE